MLKILAVAALTLLMPLSALADPVGVWSVRGVNPDNGEEYTGKVQVTRRGETYNVVWNVAGTEFIGTGLGAKFVGDRFEMGAASKDDTAISVGYISGNSFGMAMYFQQPDGHWQGVWTYGGSKKVASEDWIK